jgi:predicted MPP superfamily phosphohydrolase
MLTRRHLLYLGALGGTAAAYPIVVEPQWFETTRTKIVLTLGSRETVRILQLTDLHASWAVPMFSIRRSIQAGLSSNPDLICLTGDFITHREDFDSKAYSAALRDLTAVRPTYAVLGNHDGGPWAGGIGGHWTHQVGNVFSKKPA